MFSSAKKSMNNTTNNQKIDTLVGTQTTLTGNINSTGVVRIDGEYTGDIQCESEVIVGESGLVKGNIYSGNVSVSGEVEGNISCKGVLEILPTGKVFGDVEVDKFNVSEGAIFNGKCNMKSEGYEKLEEPRNTMEITE